MPEVTAPYEPRTPCWVDLAVPDQQAALDFYHDVLGWTGEIGPSETGGYAICTLRGKPVAGIMEAQPMDDRPAPPTAWTTYLSSADATATEQAIAGNGGTVILPVTDVMDLGRMLVAADPTGAVFGVWEPRKFPGAGIVNEPGALVWNELNTTDRDTSQAFCSAALGIETGPMEGADDYFSLSVGGRTIGGLQRVHKEAPAGTPSHWRVYFAVEDADATVEKLTAAGGNVVKAPFDMEAGRMALVEDSQGAAFAVIAPRPMSSG